MNCIITICTIIMLLIFYYIVKNTVKFPKDDNRHFANVIIIDSEVTLKKYLELTNTINIKELSEYYEQFNVYIIDKRNA